MKSLTFRYFRRFGIRSMMWLWRLMAIAQALWLGTWVLEQQPSGWPLVALVAVYGVWEISRTIRTKTPPVTILTAQTMNVRPGATVSVPSGEIDRLLKVIASAKYREVDHD